MFQRPGKGDTKLYENGPVRHNKLANMMPTISDSVGLSTRCTNQALELPQCTFLTANSLQVLLI